MKDMGQKHTMSFRIGKRTVLLHFGMVEKWFGKGDDDNVELHFDFFTENYRKASGYVKRTFTWHDVIILGILILVIPLVQWLSGWTLESSIFVVFAVAALIMSWDPRIAIMGALICLVSIMILTILYQQGIAEEEWAETVAVWAYYFLVIGVVGQIIEYTVESRKSIKLKEAENKE